MPRGLGSKFTSKAGYMHWIIENTFNISHYPPCAYSISFPGNPEEKLENVAPCEKPLPRITPRQMKELESLDRSNKKNLLVKNTYFLHGDISLKTRRM